MVTNEHVLERGKVHYKWDRNQPPAIEIEAGDGVHFGTEEVSDGQIRPGSPASDLAGIDFNRLYPLGGPVFVKGAEPGDALEIEILQLRPIDWGWAAILPGPGLLAGAFTEPSLRHSDLQHGEYGKPR